MAGADTAIAAATDTVVATAGTAADTVDIAVAWADIAAAQLAGIAVAWQAEPVADTLVAEPAAEHRQLVADLAAAVELAADSVAAAMVAAADTGNRLRHRQTDPRSSANVSSNKARLLRQTGFVFLEDKRP